MALKELKMITTLTLAYMIDRSKTLKLLSRQALLNQSSGHILSVDVGRKPSQLSIYYYSIMGRNCLDQHSLPTISFLHAKNLSLTLAVF